MTAPVLDVRGLTVRFATPRGPLHAVNGVDLSLSAGETLCLVGESGCGKSVTSLALMGLLGGGRAAVGGRALLDGVDLLALPQAALRRLRGDRIAMVFQDPMTSLNPVFTIGWQIGEALRLHRGLRGGAARRRSLELLERVGIPDPGRRLDSYPHQLSGGMRQRAMIAQALAGEPAVLIADEPTTALDVTVQAQILDLMAGLQREFGMAMLFITHDLGVVAQIASRVAVMYAGRIVEQGSAEDVLLDAAHGYTRGLLSALPDAAAVGEDIPEIPGVVPLMLSDWAHCVFQERCAYATARCGERVPDRVALPGGHWALCRETDRVRAVGVR